MKDTGNKKVGYYQAENKDKKKNSEKDPWSFRQDTFHVIGHQDRLPARGRLSLYLSVTLITLTARTCR